ncbi:MAG: hypothetical protein K6L60_06335 [Oceanobacter sp.]
MDSIDLAHIELIRFSTNIFQGKYQPAVEAAQPTTEKPIQADSDKKKQHRREEKRREEKRREEKRDMAEERQPDEDRLPVRNLLRHAQWLR